MHLKVEQTRRAFHTVNIRPCATSVLQILFDPDTESKFRFVAICIERRESKDPPSLPPDSLPMPSFSKEGSLSERRILPP